MESDDDRWRLAVEASGDALWDWLPAEGSIFSSPRLGRAARPARGHGRHRLAQPSPSGRPRQRARQPRRMPWRGSYGVRREVPAALPEGRHRWFSARGEWWRRMRRVRRSASCAMLRDVTLAREQRETLQASERLWQLPSKATATPCGTGPSTPG